MQRLEPEDRSLVSNFACRSSTDNINDSSKVNRGGLPGSHCVSRERTKTTFIITEVLRLVTRVQQFLTTITVNYRLIQRWLTLSGLVALTPDAYQ